jgi:hypothetical protein
LSAALYLLACGIRTGPGGYSPMSRSSQGCQVLMKGVGLYGRPKSVWILSIPRITAANCEVRYGQEGHVNSTGIIQVISNGNVAT